MSRYLLLFALLLLLPMDGSAQTLADRVKAGEGDAIPCCDFSDVPGFIWAGSDSLMTIADLAAYAAPILWFSPDEPLLRKIKYKEIDQPAPFPFEEGDGPVVYYRLRTLLAKDQDRVYSPRPDRGKSIINLAQLGAMDLDFFFYYPSEEGLGGHKHDVEYAEMKLVVWDRPACSDCRYSVLVSRTIGKAHGILWYDNTLDTDEYTEFPMTLLVEEGKHATCTDKNGDGYYTPGYDVNQRVNDAWGVRDIMRSGALFSGGFQSWFAKVRTDPYRVFPPLPEDSPLREEHTYDGVYAPEHAIYELRPFPNSEGAYTIDERLPHFIEDKGDPNWPAIVGDTNLRDFGRWLDEENFVKNISVAFRVDGDGSSNRADYGISVIFPLLVLKHVQDPIGGGWLVNRLYWKDENLRDFAWTVLYTTSASRWIDGYLSIGYEWGNGPEGNDDNVVTETGIKFRVNMQHSPVKFVTKLTDFWGFRFGIKNTGFFNFKRIGYTFEIGAGTF